MLSQYEALANEEAGKFNTTNFSQETKRQLFYVGSKSLSDAEMKNLSSLISEMGSIYGQVTYFLTYFKLCGTLKINCWWWLCTVCIRINKNKTEVKTGFNKSNPIHPWVRFLFKISIFYFYQNHRFQVFPPYVSIHS